MEKKGYTKPETELIPIDAEILSGFGGGYDGSGDGNNSDSDGGIKRGTWDDGSLDDESDGLW